MQGKKVFIFDTTLRDGTQGTRISFSVEDKLRIAQKLDEFGIDYIEGGWPMSNPRDFFFFQKASRLRWKHAKLVAFGSTLRPGLLPEQDPNLNQLIEAGTPAVSLFGKSWLLHVEKGLKISPEENIQLISHSIAFLKRARKEVISTPSIFFDGYKDDPSYALSTLKAAESAGADTIVLCDTNGGTLPHELVAIVQEVRRQIGAPLGIHCHNDSETAVANSVLAVLHGCQQVQGTINGYGERCGNANLCSVLPNLQLKLGFYCIPEERLRELTSLSRFVSEVANLAPPPNQPFVGRNAFAHKGGVHVSAVMRDPATYEHISPERVGNRRRVLVSDLSGRSNIFYKSKELGLETIGDVGKVSEIVRELKELEHEGYQFEVAEGSLELLLRRKLGEPAEHFSLKGFRVLIEKNENEPSRAEVSIRVLVNGRVEHTAAEGNGPVHALDNAIRKALRRFYPQISKMKLADYKVRVLNEKAGTAAKVRVLIESGDGQTSWSTMGVSENIMEASWQALSDSFNYFLLKRAVAQEMVQQNVEGAVNQ